MRLKEDGAPPSLLRRVLRAFNVPPSREPLHSVLGGRQIPEGCVPPAAAGPWDSPLPRRRSCAQTPPPSGVGVMGGGRPRDTDQASASTELPRPSKPSPGVGKCPGTSRRRRSAPSADPAPQHWLRPLRPSKLRMRRRRGLCAGVWDRLPDAFAQSRRPPTWQVGTPGSPAAPRRGFSRF